VERQREVKVKAEVKPAWLLRQSGRHFVEPVRSATFQRLNSSTFMTISQIPGLNLLKN